MSTIRKKITIMALNDTGSSVKQVAVSRTFLCFLSLFLATCLIFFGFILYDYYNVKKTLLTTQKLERKISEQLEEIAIQRKQIQSFACEINTLKSRLVDLNSFEKKIRIIAGIEETADQNTIFGVGGSIPEDLKTQIPLTERHTGLLREMHQQAEQLDLALTDQKEEFKSLFKYLEDQRNLLAYTPSIRPAEGWISSGFGYRISPFTGLRQFHRGLDIAASTGTPIIAPANGIVTYVGVKGALGRIIVIDHGHGITTRYAHIYKALKKRGEAVERGDTIALIGNTGRSTGPHLHYEVHINGIPVDPTRYILN